MSVAFHADPDRIIAQFHGNLGAIQQAAMSGTLDPTAAVLAGMKLKSAQNQQALQQGTPPTVAQDVFAPAPQMPPAPQQPPAGGLGATLPAAGAVAPTPLATPPQGDPGAPAMADGGMVPIAYAPPYQKGGLDGIPVPDTMFDENRNGGFNDGYAGGGLVAFAGGDEVTNPNALGPWFEQQVTQAIPGVGVTSRQRSAAHNAQIGGVKNSFHLTNNARDFVPPQGMTMPQLHAQIKKIFGNDYDVLNEGDHVHIEPGPKKGMQANASYTNRTAKPLDPVNPANRDQRGRLSLLDNIGMAKDLYSDLPHGQRDRAQQYYEHELDPEAQKKDATSDMWASLAEMGGNLASTPGPFLSALGSSIAKAMPGINASKKERKAAEREAIGGLMNLENMDRKEAKDIVDFGKDLWASDVSSEEKAQALAAQISMHREEIKSRESEGAADRANRLQTTQIASESRMDKGLERLVNTYLQMGINEARAQGRTPDLPALQAEAYRRALPEWQKYMRNPAQGGAASMDSLFDNSGGASSGGTDYNQWKPVQ